MEVTVCVYFLFQQPSVANFTRVVTVQRRRKTLLSNSAQPTTMAISELHGMASLEFSVPVTSLVMAARGRIDRNQPYTPALSGGVNSAE